MIEVITGVLVGIAAIAAAYFSGKRAGRLDGALKKAERSIEIKEKADEIEAKNAGVGDGDMRQWLRDNADK